MLNGLAPNCLPRLSADCGIFLVLTFFKIIFFQKILSGTFIRGSKSLDPDQDGHLGCQDRHFVRPDLGPNCSR